MSYSKIKLPPCRAAIRDEFLGTRTGTATHPDDAVCYTHTDGKQYWLCKMWKVRLKWSCPWLNVHTIKKSTICDGGDKMKTTETVKWEENTIESINKKFGMRFYEKMCLTEAYQCTDKEKFSWYTVENDIERQFIAQQMINYNQLKCLSGTLFDPPQIVCWSNNNEQCPKFKFEHETKGMQQLKLIGNDKQICSVKDTYNKEQKKWIMNVEKGIQCKWPDNWKTITDTANINFNEGYYNSNNDYQLHDLHHNDNYMLYTDIIAVLLFMMIVCFFGGGICGYWWAKKTKFHN